MAIAPGTYNLGPSNGKVILKTGVEGPGAKMAHSLVIEPGSWSATAVVADDPSQSKLTFSADIPAFNIVSGTGGVKPLSDKDKVEIKKSIEGKILGTGKITFESTSVSGSADSATVTGNLTINGNTGTQTFTVSTSGNSVTAKGTVVQTNFGIKPFKGPLGAFRLTDAVEVEFTGSV